jgi:Tfp pilus assembly protein PilF
MSRTLHAAAAIGVGLLLWPRPAGAQLESSTIRGQVVDEEGRPLTEVKIELEFKGESRQKILKKATTDKKGAFLHVGLKPGQWQVTVSKEGFKTARFETYLSAGGISEIPPVRLAALPPEAPDVASAGVKAEAAALRAAERGKELGETYNKAVEALTAGQSAEAEALFKAVLAEAPGLAAAHHNLGYLYTRRSDYAAAEAEFRKAIELQPETGDSYVALAGLLSGRQRGEEALALLQGAAAGFAFAEDAKFQLALGTTAFNLGRNAEAEPALIKAAELDPSQVEVHFLLGSVALGRSDIPAAVARLEKYVAVAPEGAANLATAKALLATLRKKK